MSNRAAVFNNGRLEQVGSPREVYESPQTTFVAFVGTSNVLHPEQSKRLLGVDAAHSLRPERVRLDGAPADDGEVSVDGVLPTCSTSAPTAVPVSTSTTAATCSPTCRARRHDPRHRHTGAPHLAAAGGVRRRRHRDDLDLAENTTEGKPDEEPDTAD